MRRSTPFAAACAALLALAACQDDVVTDPDGSGARVPAATSVPLDSGYVMRDGTPIKVVYEIRHGRAVFEGDIDLGPAGEIARSVEELRRRPADGDGPQFGVVTSSSSRRWGNGVVPYVIESTVPDPGTITAAMAHIEGQVRGVDFVPRTSQSSWIIFRRTTDPNICGSSPVGRAGGGQVVLIGDYCGMGSAVHEILHSLGFWHEQSRCDRDTYVEILYANIEANRSSNFDKHCTGASTVFAYDEGSIMHYPWYAFGKVVNGSRLQTIRSRRGLDYQMGQRSGLSWQDIRTAVWMYPTAPVIYPIDWQSYEPILFWRDTRAGSYDIYLVTVESWQHAYNGSGSDTWKTHLGTTSDTTFMDMSNTSTGRYWCDTTQDYYYEQRGQDYYYEVVASFGYNVTRSHRVGAAVGRC